MKRIKMGHIKSAKVLSHLSHFETPHICPIWFETAKVRYLDPMSLLSFFDPTHMPEIRPDPNPQKSSQHTTLAGYLTQLHRQKNHTLSPECDFYFS
jgi:hypothetical protein